MTFVTEFPKSEIADKALFNASHRLLQRARCSTRRSRSRKRLIAQVPEVAVRAGSDVRATPRRYEAIADFEQAADDYEPTSTATRSARTRRRQARRAEAKAHAPRRARRAPRTHDAEGARRADVGRAKAQIALFNAGVFREGLGQYKAALKNREQYLELWPEVKDAEAVFLSIVDLTRRTATYGKAHQAAGGVRAEVHQGPEQGPHWPRAASPASTKTS